MVRPGNWVLVRRQHGVIAHWQLLECGLTPEAIRHRVKVGRLRCLYRGVYAIGRLELSQHGKWMAAVLACGDGALLSHESAAALWGIRPIHAGAIHVSVPATHNPNHPGIHVHRRSSLGFEHRAATSGIPLTSIPLTLVDLATHLGRDSLEAAINEADKLDLTTPDELRYSLADLPKLPGTGRLRTVLDHRTFTLTDSHLERRFLGLAERAGLPRPETQQHLHGHRVDFHWPELNLVVETDGLRYHRTPAQQASDRHRDQVLTAAGLTVLRFTHAQVRYDPAEVIAILAATSRRAGRAY